MVDGELLLGYLLEVVSYSHKVRLQAVKGEELTADALGESANRLVLNVPVRDREPS